MSCTTCRVQMQSGMLNCVDEYGNVTSRAVVDVPKGCCFTVSVEYVSGVVNDPTVVPTSFINVIDGSLSINRVA